MDAKRRNASLVKYVESFPKGGLRSRQNYCAVSAL
jgi:hypothetical protein